MFKANTPYCPIVSMENEFFGTIKSIESFTNIDLGSVRSVNIEGNPYFFMKDVCAILGITSTSAITTCKESLDRMNPSMGDTDSWVPRNYIPYYLMIDQPVQTGIKADGTPAFRNGKAMVVSEPALYYFIMRSNKPKAVQFQNWVYNTILPNIRKMPDRITKEIFDILEDFRKNTAPMIADTVKAYKENANLQNQIGAANGYIQGLNNSMNSFAYKQNVNFAAVVNSNIDLLKKMENIDDRFKQMYDFGYGQGYNRGYSEGSNNIVR